MAEAEHEYVHGSMNIEAQRETYAMFWAVTKWASVLIGITLLLLALTRTNAIDCTKGEVAARNLIACGKMPLAAETHEATEPAAATEAPASEPAPAAPAPH